MSLAKYEKACTELGVSLKEVKNGVVSLKEPMQIIRELAEEYVKLDKADARRANLLNSVGGKYRANALNSLLENYDTTISVHALTLSSEQPPRPM